MKLCAEDFPIQQNLNDLNENLRLKNQILLIFKPIREMIY